MQTHSLCTAVVRVLPDAFRRYSVRTAPVFSTLLAAVCLFCFVVPATAQVTNPAELSPELDELFTQGEFARVEIEALRMLRDASEEEVDTQIAAHLYLGFVEVLTGRDEAAREDFHAAIELRHTLMLDPVYVPPVVFEAFEEVRIDYMEEFLLQESTDEEPQVIIQKETVPRGNAALANLLVPGLGFWAEGRSWRGMGWFAMEAAGVAAFVYSLAQTVDARETYMATTRPDLFEERYDTYNLWYKRSWTWGAVAAAVYLAAQIDYHYTPGVPRMEPALLGPEDDPQLGVRFVIPINWSSARL